MELGHPFSEMDQSGREIVDLLAGQFHFCEGEDNDVFTATAWSLEQRQRTECAGVSLFFFFFIFVALFKRKNLTSELYIVQVRLHVCVNVSTCARVIFLVV